MSKRRGRYIVWEGSDGVGKSTQMAVAAQESRRRGIPTRTVREPGGSDIGAPIRKILLDPNGPDLHPKAETALFLGDRAQLWHHTIEPALEGGYDVHTDRNWWSTLAYQGAGGELSTDFIVTAHELFMPEGYLHPNVGLVFHLTEEERQARKSRAATDEFGKPDRIEQKKQDFFKRVEHGYEYVRDRLGGTGVHAAGEPEEVTARWWSYVFPEAT